ncbi:MAG: HAMP domain-containing protein [Bacteriovoracaceae bacterium]|nr:HAMP domain-containing protein [Bacteriovoracaceae bacterium]
MFKKVSLKYKLLLLLVAAPVFTLLSYLLMATDIFEEDKLAYIYSSNLTNVKTLSTQLRSDLEIVDKTKDVILTGFNTEVESFDVISQNTFDDENSILLIQVYANKGLADLNLAAELKQPNLKDEILNFVDANIKTALSEVINNQQIVKVVNSTEGIFSSFSLLKTRQGKGYLVATVFKSNLILEAFYGDSLFSNYLLGNDGKIIMGKSEIWGESIYNFNSLSFYKKILENKFDQGTLEAREFEKPELLVAFTRLPDLGYTIVTVLEKEFALRALYTLIIKSLIFLVFIVSLSIILSVIASNKLTSTLRKLLLGSEEIGKGNFGVRIQIDSGDEIGRLGESFNLMATKISKLLTELKEYSETLELKVQERTAELNRALKLQEAMVDSLGQGFFIFNESGEILPVYSKASERIFNTTPSGKFIGDLLNVPEGEKNSFKDFCRSMINEDLPFQDLAIMAPNRVNREDRSIFVEYNPIRDESSKISGVVVVATDKTEEVKALKEAEKERKFVEMIVKMMSNKGQFLKFLQETKKYLKETKDFVLSGEEPKSGELREDVLFRGMHTLKGNSGLFHMIEVHKYAHEIENHITDIKNSPVPQKAKKYETLIIMLENMEDIFKNFVSANKKVLGIKSWNNFEKAFEVSVDKLQTFLDKMKTHNVHDELLDNFMDTIYSEATYNFLAQYEELTEEVATKLGKEINPLQIFGGEIRLNGKVYDELFSSLVHAVRNAIDHGIEKPDVREERGKPRKGTIQFFVEKIQSDSGTMLQIIMQDDGGGVDPERIRKKLTNDGKADVIQGMDDQEVIQQIFAPGFSTNTEVTDLSGRGVGMDAIMNVCKSLNGTIWVESEVKKGTKFIIQVPFRRQ